MLLPLAAPLIDLFAIYSILFLDPLPILAFWGAFTACQFVLAWVAFGWDNESRTPLWWLPLQQIVYRQLMYLVVIDTMMVAMMGTRLRWHRLARTGQPGSGAGAETRAEREHEAGLAEGGEPERAPTGEGVEAPADEVEVVRTASR